MNGFAPGPDLLHSAQSMQSDTVDLRRQLHRQPEVGLQLPQTQQLTLDALTGLGLDITLGSSTTSIVADLDTGKPGPTVLLRGDMDALPLQEDNPIDYVSRNDGKMHACGHDTHVSMLVSAARILSANTDSFGGKVRFMFQPGEEGYHGARYMIEEGVLDGVDRAFAIHVFTNLSSGVVATRPGPFLASADRFEITVEGKGGHASAPHNCVDPIPAAAATITGIHTMVGRSTDPTQSGLVTVSHIEAGTTNNIIPHSAFMEGTIRSLDEDTRATLHDGVKRVSQGMSAAHGCSCSTEIIPGYPVTVNHADQVDLVADVAASVLGPERYATMPRPLLGAEDFSYVLREVPGAMAALGVCPKGDDPASAAPNHSNLMTVDEDAMSNGVALYVGMALAG